MLLAYLTYEAYLNFLGERFAAEVWAKEHEFFTKDPYWGLDGKLTYLAETIPVTGIKKGERPYQTIKNLKSLRDFLSHGKIDRYTKTITHHRDDEPPLFGPYGKLDKLVTPGLASRAVSDVKEFIEFLHNLAGKQTEDILFGKDPFEGFMQHADSDSRTSA